MSLAGCRCALDLSRCQGHAAGRTESHSAPATRWLERALLRVITAPKADSECKIGATAASWNQIDKKSMHLKEK